MSERKRMTTWVPTIVLGVLAILFSVYALQEQTEVQGAKEEAEKLKSELTACRQQLEEQKANTAAYLEEGLRQAKQALAEAEDNYAEALKREKSKRK